MKDTSAQDTILSLDHPANIYLRYRFRRLCMATALGALVAVGVTGSPVLIVSPMARWFITAIAYIICRREVSFLKRVRTRLGPRSMARCVLSAVSTTLRASAIIAALRVSALILGLFPGDIGSSEVASLQVGPATYLVARVESGFFAAWPETLVVYKEWSLTRFIGIAHTVHRFPNAEFSYYEFRQIGRRYVLKCSYLNSRQPRPDTELQVDG